MPSPTKKANGEGKTAKIPLVFSSIDELNKHAENKKIDIKSSFQCKQYCTSSNDVFRKADALYAKGDEENAYILFMRYFKIVTDIKKTYEFTKNKVVLVRENFGRPDYKERLESLNHRIKAIALDVQAEELLLKANLAHYLQKSGSESYSDSR